MSKNGVKSMTTILEKRLISLQQKEESANTDIEKQIYSEAITHCHEDIERACRSARLRKIKALVTITFFIAIIVLSIALMHKKSSSSNSVTEEGPSIGSAVRENSTVQ